MNSASVIIKSNKNGLIVILDEKLPFEELLADVKRKFEESARFFQNAKMALSFRGRVLNRDEERRVVETIVNACGVHILCVADEPKEHEEYYRQILSYALEEKEERDSRFYRESVRDGQLLESDGSLVILGDVNPGARVSAKGNVIVLGALRGTVCAGSAGDPDCFIAALVMKPIQLRIAGRTAVSAIAKRTDIGEYAVDPQIAFLKDGHMKIGPADAETFRQMQP